MKVEKAMIHYSVIGIKTRFEGIAEMTQFMGEKRMILSGEIQTMISSLVIIKMILFPGEVVKIISLAANKMIFCLAI